ncbi:MAG: gephyrin-like molybdotransferase Glp [Isosphaeraceae bacterium]
MRGFRGRTAVETVVDLIDARVARLGVEQVPLPLAAGRVLGEAVTAGCEVPPFDRASMDGYAVRGEETYGADAYTPAIFLHKGEARPGRMFAGVIGPGEAVEIATGAPIPAGADTVVPAEATAREGDRILVHEAVPVGRHVGRVGEDIRAGVAVLPAGRILRPQDLGVLSAIGVGNVAAVERPIVTILATGDELLPPGTPPSGHRFADMNSPMLAALAARDGGVVRLAGPLPDRREVLRDALAEAAGRSHVVLISGGSSTGPEDHAPGLVAELGELPVHGVALRPASPTGLGFVGGVPVVLLPGNPVSCLCAYDLFAGRIVRRLGGRPADWPYRSIERPLAHKLVSAVGRVDYARVKLVEAGVEPLAVSGASILSSTTRADGFVLVPADLEGYPAGTTVTIWLYDA